MKHYLLLLTLLISSLSIGQDIPKKPVPPRLVNDYVGVLNSKQERDLESSLTQFAKQTSTQIAVLVVKDFGGTSREDFAQKVAEEWGVGQKGKNNGIVMVIKPKIDNARGEAYIATGYGLEGAVPDAVAHRIVDFEMIPSFKEGDYYTGIKKASLRLMELTKGEYTADEYMGKTSTNSGLVMGLFGLALFGMAALMFRRGQKKRRRSNIGSSKLPYWLLMSMMGNSNRRSHGGSFGDFSSGSGGFGGFGGGTFGGGGAGGSW